MAATTGQQPEIEMSFETDYLDGAASHSGSADQPSQRPDAATVPPFCRIPVRSLSDRHRARILMHLLALAAPDRYLRFGYAATDAQLAHYADNIDFSRDEVHGVFNRRLDLVGTVHLALLPSAGARTEAELGLSVLPRVRGRGIGRRLFDRAVLHARNRGIDTLLIHTLSENAAMLHIAVSAGATVVRDGGEALARLRLPRDDLFSHVDALVANQAGDLDFRIKRRALHRRPLSPEAPDSGARVPQPEDALD